MDVMGGDNAPLAPIKGGVMAAKTYGEEVLLVGPEDTIRGILKEQGAENTPGITIVHAPDVVDMHDEIAGGEVFIGPQRGAGRRLFLRPRLCALAGERSGQLALGQDDEL